MWSVRPKGGAYTMAETMADGVNEASQNASDKGPFEKGTGDVAATDGGTVEERLAAAQREAAANLDGWQRARADFVNYRKRAEKELEQAFSHGTVDTLRRLLPVIDDFDRAVQNVPADRAEDDVLKGFNLIHRKFTSLLETAGVRVINPAGEPFDPLYHEAIGHDDGTDVPNGHVSTVLQKGYLHGDKVIRPALVRVAS